MIKTLVEARQEFEDIEASYRKWAQSVVHLPITSALVFKCGEIRTISTDGIDLRTATMLAEAVVELLEDKK